MTLRDGAVQDRVVQTRLAAIAEALLIPGLVLLIIWVVKPAGRRELDLALRVLVAILLFGSSLFHRDSRTRLGLRLDTFWAAFARVLPISLLVAGVSLVAGYYLGTIDPPDNLVLELAYYFGWALAQQYALQAVILLRLEDGGLRGSSPLAAATLFALVHAPNPGLTILTFLGGLLWCSTFRRYPNLFAVSLSHAVVAVVVASTLPDEVTGSYRIGPAYRFD
jgi:membrane protease YdiL (CAAX protease family)